MSISLLPIPLDTALPDQTALGQGATNVPNLSPHRPPQWRVAALWDRGAHPGRHQGPCTASPCPAGSRCCCCSLWGWGRAWGVRPGGWYWDTGSLQWEAFERAPRSRWTWRRRRKTRRKSWFGGAGITCELSFVWSTTTAVQYRLARQASNLHPTYRTISFLCVFKPISAIIRVSENTHAIATCNWQPCFPGSGGGDLWSGRGDCVPKW